MPSSTASGGVSLFDRMNATVDYHQKVHKNSLHDENLTSYPMDFLEIVIGAGDGLNINLETPWPQDIEIVTEDTSTGDGAGRKLSLTLVPAPLVCPKTGQPVNGPPTPTHSDLYLPEGEVVMLQDWRNEKQRKDFRRLWQASPAQSRDPSPSISEDHETSTELYEGRTGRALTEISIEPTVAGSMAITENDEPRSPKDEGPRSPLPWSTFYPSTSRYESQMGK